MRSVFQVRCHHLPVERPTQELVFFETESTTFTMFIENWPWEDTFADVESDDNIWSYSREPSELERLIQTQQTHDVICPVCHSCITEVVILRKRKRSSGVEEETFHHVKLRKANAADLRVSGRLYKGRAYPGSRREDPGCLVGLWSFLFGREGKRSQLT